MYKSVKKVHDLPTDLQHLVYMFAFNLPKSDVQGSLRTVLEIKRMKLPFFFLRDKIWSWHYAKFLVNPLVRFMPIEYFNGTFRELFDDDAMYCFLFGLDFRMRNVRKFGNRQAWENRILQSWRVVKSLALYFKMILRSETRVLRKQSIVKSQQVLEKSSLLPHRNRA